MKTTSRYSIIQTTIILNRLQKSINSKLNNKKLHRNRQPDRNQNERNEKSNFNNKIKIN